MKRFRWRIATERGDIMPFVIGCILLFMSVPAFLLMLLAPERNAGVIAMPVLTILGAGAIAGVGFIVLGMQLCARLGSWAYRIAHGRFFRN